MCMLLYPSSLCSPVRRRPICIGIINLFILSKYDSSWQDYVFVGIDVRHWSRVWRVLGQHSFQNKRQAGGELRDRISVRRALSERELMQMSKMHHIAHTNYTVLDRANVRIFDATSGTDLSASSPLAGCNKAMSKMQIRVLSSCLSRGRGVQGPTRKW